MSTTIPTTMRAWQYSSTSPKVESNLILNTAATLPPTFQTLKKNQALIRVLAVAMNPADYIFPEVPLFSSLVVGKPAIPCMDYAGRVVAVGPDSDTSQGSILTPGQIIIGHHDIGVKFGALAEYTLTNRSNCTVMPKHMDIAKAASLGTAGLTAYQSITNYAKAGDRIFINGGSGGVGTQCIQIAKLLGMTVVTSCSTANVDLCKSLGADVVLDYTKEDIVSQLLKLPTKVNHIIDFVGTNPQMYYKSHQYATPSTTFVQVAGGFSASAIYDTLCKMLWPGALGGGKRKFTFMSAAMKQADLARVAAWLAEGKLKVIVDEKYEFDSTSHGPVQAFEKSRSGRSKGKLIIEVPE